MTPDTVGIIYTGYQTEDLLPRSLTPWIEARRARLGGRTFLICAVSVPFEGFDHTDTVSDATQTTLLMHKASGNIDEAIIGNVPLKETDARGKALQWLKAKGATLIVQWDSDEIASQDDITNILSYIDHNVWVPSFRISYRNTVFTENQYLEEPFTPMRIHRVALNTGHVAQGFYDDNNVWYQRIGDRPAQDVELGTLTVPKELAWPRHLTWLDDGPNGRSARKIRYQASRGWSCSYRYDAVHGLCFDEAHFARKGEPLPTVLIDEDQQLT